MTEEEFLQKIEETKKEKMEIIKKTLRSLGIEPTEKLVKKCYEMEIKV